MDIDGGGAAPPSPLLPSCSGCWRRAGTSDLVDVVAVQQPSVMRMVCIDTQHPIVHSCAGRPGARKIASIPTCTSRWLLAMPTKSEHWRQLVQLQHNAVVTHLQLMWCQAPTEAARCTLRSGKIGTCESTVSWFI